LFLFGIFDCLVFAGLCRVKNQNCFGLFLSMVVCNIVVKVKYSSVRMKRGFVCCGHAIRQICLFFLCRYRKVGLDELDC
jgi:hypothetical protein